MEKVAKAQAGYWPLPEAQALQTAWAPPGSSLSPAPGSSRSSRPLPSSPSSRFAPRSSCPGLLRLLAPHTRIAAPRPPPHLRRAMGWGRGGGGVLGGPSHVTGRALRMPLPELAGRDSDWIFSRTCPWGRSPPREPRPAAASLPRFRPPDNPPESPASSHTARCTGRGVSFLSSAAHRLPVSPAPTMSTRAMAAPRCGARAPGSPRPRAAPRPACRGQTRGEPGGGGSRRSGDSGRPRPRAAGSGGVGDAGRRAGPHLPPAAAEPPAPVRALPA